MSAPRVPRSGFRGPALAGALVIAAVFGGFGGWAAVAPLSGAVIAPGVVVVEGQRKKVQNLDGGTVAELLVQDGDRVVAGQALMKLDDSRARASVGVLSGQLDAVLGQDARLVAERDDRPAIDFPNDLLSRAGDLAVNEILAGQRLLFEAGRTARRGEVAILQKRIQQLNEEIAGFAAQIKAKQTQTGLIQEELRGLNRLLEKGLVERTRVLALERESARIGGELGELHAGVARARQAIGEADLQILQLTTVFRERVARELRDVQTTGFDLRERLDAARAALERTVVRAPVGGTAVGLGVHTVGGVVKPGETMLEVVPEGQRLLIEAQVQPMDVDQVPQGMAAELVLSALNQRRTTTVTGDVLYVSADRLTDTRTGTPYYLVRIGLREDGKDEGPRLLPGMPVEAYIQTGQRTALQYLAQPLSDAVRRAWREP